MALILVASVVVVVLGFWIKSRRNRHLVDEHTITPEGLHALLDAKQDVLIFDVRQPLDMLVDSEIIPGANGSPHKRSSRIRPSSPKRRMLEYCTPNDGSLRHSASHPRADPAIDPCLRPQTGPAQSALTSWVW